MNKNENKIIKNFFHPCRYNVFYLNVSYSAYNDHRILPPYNTTILLQFYVGETRGGCGMRSVVAGVGRIIIIVIFTYT